MSTLSERLHRGAASAPSQVDHARRLVADWWLLADLAFADLTLWVPLQSGAWWCVAQVRPLTAPTSQPEALGGSGAPGPAPPRLRPPQWGAGWCVARVRPRTAPTSQPEDLVGSEATGPAAEPLARAHR